MKRNDHQQDSVVQLVYLFKMTVEYFLHVKLYPKLYVIEKKSGDRKELIWEKRLF